MLGAEDEDEDPEESEKFDEHEQEEKADAVETVEVPEEVEAEEAEEDEHLKLEHDARQQMRKDRPAGEPASAAQVSAQEPLPDDRVKAIRQAMAGFTLTPPPWAAQVDEAIWMQKVGKEQRSASKKDPKAQRCSAACEQN